ncbi:MAG: DUF5106 domain-containing protein [Bacteroidales bacterium]|nr:DUF5106 domain-containing protein [Bacteroidales bacterium]
MDTAREEFLDFAELAASAPQEDALAALDVLYDKLMEDAVSYYLYNEWADAAFYSVLSPCRNAALYDKIVERMESDGVLSASECEPFQKRRNWIQYNLVNTRATVPGVMIKERTLVLVVDTGCPSCREALTKLYEKPEFADTRKVAVCCGFGPVPTAPGWEFVNDTSDVFDISITPVFFVVNPDGMVESSYTLVL